MKLVISIIALSSLFLIAIPFVHLSSEDQGISYIRYREQYAHNLRNPLIKHYRELSCEPSTEMAIEEYNQKDKR